MPQTASIFMPCLLSEEQKFNHVSTCQDLQGRLQRPKFFLKIIAGVEMWVYRYNQEVK
jgi:hypothetical protein